jgi:hypothetical protein
MLVVGLALVLITQTFRVKLVQSKQATVVVAHKTETEMVELILVVVGVLLQTLLIAVKLETVMAVLVLLSLDIQTPIQ